MPVAYEWSKSKEFWFNFYDLVRHLISAAAYQTGRPDKNAIKIILSKFVKAHDIRIKVT
jgi:hypothetical protein